MQKTTYFKVLSMFSSLLIGATATASVVNVKELNQKLSKTHAGWVAKDTWVNQLSKAEVQRILGVKDVPGNDVEFISPDSMTLKAGEPASLDWRSKDGKNWVSPILNQANCGSCVAFAAVGVMETQFNIASIFPALNLKLSTQNLFACGGGGCETGWFPSAAARRLMNAGVPDEACMPYTSGATGQDASCSASCADTQQRSRKIAGYKSPTRSMVNVAAVKQALQKGPVMTTLTVFADFLTYAGGIYQHTTGSALGGHAISIVGYDDNERVFIIRNSWGEDWGEKGFGRVSYDDRSGVGQQTWSFEVPALSGAVSIVSPRDYSYVTGNVEFNVQSTYPATDSLSLTVYDSNNTAVWTSSCVSAVCIGKLDSLKLKDGRYEVQATALGTKGNQIDSSTREFFYVVNQKPNFKLDYTGRNVDLNQDLKERIEFDITTATSSVPMSSLEFHYKDSSGLEKIKVANIVLNQMTMGWRTNVIPNGSYEIWMVGALKSNSMEVKVETAHRTVNVNN